MAEAHQLPTQKETEEREKISLLKPGDIIKFSVTFEEDEEDSSPFETTIKVTELEAGDSLRIVLATREIALVTRILIIKPEALEWCSNRQEWMLVDGLSSVRNPCTWSKHRIFKL